MFIVILLFRSNEKSSLAETAHGTLVSLLRSWIGVLYFCDPSEDHSKSGLSSIVRALHVQNSMTRVSNIYLFDCIEHWCTIFALIFKIAIINLLREILGFCPAEWVDDVDIAIESVNPYKYQEKFGLNSGFVYAEALDIIPSLSNKRYACL